MISIDVDEIYKKIKKTNFNHMEGVVKNIIGLTIEVKGVKGFVGEIFHIYNEENNSIVSEEIYGGYR